jgi:hypothetical protein
MAKPGSISIRLPSCVASVKDDAVHASTHFLQIFQKERTYQTTDANLSLVRLALMNSVDLDANEVETLIDARKVLIARDSVERFDHEYVKLTGPRAVHHQDGRWQAFSDRPAANRLEPGPVRPR